MRVTGFEKNWTGIKVLFSYCVLYSEYNIRRQDLHFMGRFRMIDKFSHKFRVSCPFCLKRAIHSYIFTHDRGHNISLLNDEFRSYQILIHARQWCKAVRLMIEYGSMKENRLPDNLPSPNQVIPNSSTLFPGKYVKKQYWELPCCGSIFSHNWYNWYRFGSRSCTYLAREDSWRGFFFRRDVIFWRINHFFQVATRFYTHPGMVQPGGRVAGIIATMSSDGNL